MSDELTNIGNPLNSRDDLETRKQPQVTPIPPETQADDLFDDSQEQTPPDLRRPPAEPSPDSDESSK